MKQKDTDEAKLRFCIDLFNIVRGKKPLTKQCYDLVKASLKKLVSGIFSKNDMTHDQVNSFMSRLCAAEKIGSLKKNMTNQEMEKLLSECSNLIKHSEGNWTAPQVKN